MKTSQHEGDTPDYGEIDLNINPARNDPWQPIVCSSNTTPTLGFISNPEYRIKTSEEHIATLEAKIHKLKGRRSKEPCARDLLESLSAVREDSTRNNHTLSSEAFYADTISEEDSALAQLQRKIHPERQAITTDELLHLVDHDQLQSVILATNSDSKENVSNESDQMNKSS